MAGNWHGMFEMVSEIKKRGTGKKCGNSFFLRILEMAKTRCISDCFLLRCFCINASFAFSLAVDSESAESVLKISTVLKRLAG